MDKIHWMIYDSEGQLIAMMEKISDEMKINIVTYGWLAFEKVDNKKLVDSCLALKAVDFGLSCIHDACHHF